MGEALSWTHPIVVAHLPEEGIDLDLAPDEASRKKLAQQVGVLAMPAVTARVRVRPDGSGGAAVEGVLEATVRQACVVTLELFDNAIVETIAVRFAPKKAMITAATIEAEVDGDADPLIDGKLDLAAVVAEFLALAIDPYPRRPGAVFSPPVQEEASDLASAFAALAKLKAPSDEKS